MGGLEWDQRAQVRYLTGDQIDQLFARIEELGVNDDEAWYLTDNLGSVRHLVDNSGTALATLAYDSFGNLTTAEDADSDRFRFTGREWDAETGLYYYRARMYDPATGRFVSEDPARFDAGDTNLRRYVGNTPTNAKDPTGRCDDRVFYPSGSTSPNDRYYLYPHGKGTILLDDAFGFKERGIVYDRTIAACDCIKKALMVLRFYQKELDEYLKDMPLLSKYLAGPNRENRAYFEAKLMQASAKCRDRLIFRDVGIVTNWLFKQMGRGTLAYTREVGGPIFICSPFFKLKKEDQIETIWHEVGRVVGFWNEKPLSGDKPDEVGPPEDIFKWDKVVGDLCKFYDSIKKKSPRDPLANPP